MASDIVTVRLDEKTRKQIAEFSRKKFESQSDTIRKAILEYVQKENELNEVKQVMAKKLMDGIN